MVKTVLPVGVPGGPRPPAPLRRSSPARDLQIRRLRRRVSGVLLLTLAASLAVGWGTAVLLSQRAVGDQVDDRLDDLAADAADGVASVGEPRPAISPARFAFDPSVPSPPEHPGATAVVRRAALDARRSGDPVRRDGRIDGIPVRVLARVATADTGLVEVAVVDRRDPDAVTDRLARDLAVALAAAFLVSVLAVAAIARRSTRHLEDVFRQEDRLLLAATHELRGPLSWMAATAVEGLRHGRAPADALAEVAQATASMADLLDDLTEAARVLSGAAERLDETVRLDHLVRTLADDPGAPEADLRLDLGPVTVPGSPGLLRRATSNLVRNAARHGYGGRGGPVTLVVDGRGITVSDDGPGMDAEQLAVIRSQIPSGIRIGDAGAGLGLALAAWVAQVHGGHLEVANRAPHGFEATLRLPTTPAVAGPAPDASTEGEPCACS